MKKKYPALDGLIFPLSIYLIGLLLLAIGNNFSADNEVPALILEAFRYGGNLFVQAFPLLMIIGIIGNRHQSSVPTAAGILCFFIFYLINMFFSSQDYNSCYYFEGFGLSINIADVLGGRERTYLPVNGGLLISWFIIFNVSRAYRKSRERMNYGLLNFINNDTIFFISVIAETVLAAIGYAYGFRYIVNGIDSILKKISTNRTDPLYMFFYGIVERILEILGFGKVTRENFWFGSLGGNYLDNSGATFLGDVNIWTIMLQSDTVLRGAGRFIAAYYPLNCLIVPAMIITLLFQGNNKIEKQKIFGVGIVAIVASLFSSSLLPLELLLAVIAPMLLVMHILLSGALYGVLEQYHVYLGYSFNGNHDYAYPGSINELIYYLRKLDFNAAVIRILIIGAAFAVVYVIITLVYYRFLSFSFTSRKKQFLEKKEIISCFGGVRNLRFVKSSINSLQIGVFNEEKVDTQRLLSETGTIKVTESAYGYNIEYGPGASILCRLISRELKSFEAIEKYFAQ
ncbi:MAG: hypothetical protein IJM15_02180 [Erysipelotrichaceae bacterium]|nr:hypothetical protein [Erysipelotrichaceae bacterium]